MRRAQRAWRAASERGQHLISFPSHVLRGMGQLTFSSSLWSGAAVVSALVRQGDHSGGGLC